MAINYKGIAFPFQIGTTSVPKEATNEDLIKQSLVQIIMTSKGERYMRPEFGCDALSFLFEPSTDALETQIRSAVAAAVSKNERRVLVQNIDIVANDDRTELEITVHYLLVATGENQQLTVTVG